MKASDLRIGNIISIVGQPSGERFYYILDSFSSMEMVLSKKEYQPIGIPLTEDWLLDFGLKKLSIGDGNEYLININGHGWSINLKSGSIGFDYLEYKDIFNIIYVHQLQNIYHALTNEELTIKEKV